MLLSDENFGKLVSGKAMAQSYVLTRVHGRYDSNIFDFRLFMSGKLKVKGNVMKGKTIQTHFTIC